MKAPLVQIEHGFVIVKPDGWRWDKFFYPRKEAAESVARTCGTGLRVLPARQVFSLRQVSATTMRGRTELIIDRGAA